MSTADSNFLETGPVRAVPQSGSFIPSEFEYDLETNRLQVVGYSPAEVAELMSLYREHLRKLAEWSQAAEAAVRGVADTFRSGPGGGGVGL